MIFAVDKLDVYLALLIEHGESHLLWLVRSGLGPAQVSRGALQIVPRVHDVVCVAVIVEVLALMDQSQSPRSDCTFRFDGLNN